MTSPGRNRLSSLFFRRTGWKTCPYREGRLASEEDRLESCPYREDGPASEEDRLESLSLP